MLTLDAPLQTQAGPVARMCGGVTHAASMTTATPSGSMASLMACAICFVSRSWICQVTKVPTDQTGSQLRPPPIRAGFSLPG
jgi:hypothetical protein